MQRHEFDDYIKDYRDHVSNVLAVSGETSEFFAHYKSKKLIEWLPWLTQKTYSILDYGCGDGVMTKHLSKLVPNSHHFGTDPSSKSIQEAQKQFPLLSFATISDSRIPYEDNTFDLIYAAGVFHHIPFEEHVLWRNEIFRVLKDGGSFVMFELNPINPGTQYVFRTSPIDKNAHMLYPRYARSLLSPMGSCDLKYYCFFPGWLRKLRVFEPYITRVPLGGHYAVIITKPGATSESSKA